MPHRPPSPSTPTAAPTIAPSTCDLDGDGRLVATTEQLATCIENATGYRPDEAAIEPLLVELDRSEFLEWVSISRDGEYVWDLTEFPDRVAEAVVTRLVSTLR